MTRAADPTFFSRPAPGPEGRIAFTARGRVWIADSTANGEYQARAVDPRFGDRPRWLTTHSGLAMTLWYGEQADLAVWTEGELRRLTTTPEEELLADVGPQGELLFERGGALHLLALDWESGEPRAGAERELTRGREGRFTPDGKHLLFVRGHESEALGIWRQGYEGGDDADVFHLTIANGAVTQLTDAPGNDELPLPLDDQGRRFLVLRERDGKPYRPWVVEVVSSKVQRVRRLPMPEGEWPLLFPAMRILDLAPAPGDTSLGIDLWVEGDGRLYSMRGAIEPRKLVFPMAVEVPIHLEGDGYEKTGAPGHVPAIRFRAILAALAKSPIAAPRLAPIPVPERERFATAIAGASGFEAAALGWRFCGRLALPGFGRARDQRWDPGVSAEHSPAVGSNAHYVALGESLAGVGPAARLPLGTDPLVLDLRAAGGWEAVTEADWSPLAAACAGRPIVVLIDQQTWGRGEILAARLREECGAIMVGRRTAGLAIETATIETATMETTIGGADLPLPFPASELPTRVPTGEVKLPTGKVLDGRGVFPEVLVGERIDPTTEPWPAGVREGLTRAVSGSRRRGGARRRPQ